MPQYLLLLRDASSYPKDMSPEEIQTIIQRYADWRESVKKDGHSITGHKLRDREGRTVRGKDATITDGPYAESREVVGGQFLVEAPSYDAAVALSRGCPHLEFGSIEIREVEFSSK